MTGRGPLFQPLLFRLELLRTLGGGLAPFVLAVLIVLVLAPWSTPELVAIEPRAEIVARGLERQGVWTGALLFLVPALFWRAAGTFARWRQGDADWLGSRPTGRLAALVSTWAGTVAAGACLLAAVALFVEVAADGGEETFAYAGTSGLAEVRRVEPGTARVFRMPDPEGRAPAGSRVRARVTVTVGAGPTTVARLTARRAVEGGGERSATVRVLARTWLEVELPPGPGDLELEIASEGDGALAVLAPDSFQLWVPGGDERRASSTIFVRAALGLAAGLALAMGLGAWVSPITAGLGALLLWPLLELSFGAPGWLPAARLARALAFVGEGRLPEALDPRALLGLVACVALGLALALAGLRSWRHGR